MKSSPDMNSSGFTRRRFDATSPIYNLIDWPAERWFYQHWRKKLWAKVTGPEVLEIGIGTGKNIGFYTPDLNVNGIDLSPGMLKGAEKKADMNPGIKVNLHKMDVQQMNFENRHFDEVIATFAFCCVPELVLGLKEALRVTKKGGVLHLLNHMRPFNPGLSYVMKLLDRPIHYLSGVHIARNTPEYIKEAGWEIKEEVQLGYLGIFRLIRAVKLG